MSVSRLTVSENGSKAEVMIPMLGNEVFCRAGVPGAWNISSIFETVKLAAFHHTDFLGGFYLKGTHLMFLVMSNYSLEESFFRNAKQQWLNVGLRGSTELVSFGKSSFVLESHLSDAESGQKYGTHTMKYVCVDPKTRRATPLPDWLRNHYLSLENKVVVLNKARQEVPSTASTIPFVVYPSDLDASHHVNQPPFVRMVVDTATIASLEGQWSWLSGDMCHYPVRSLIVIHQSEALLGDNLTCHVWEADEPYVLEYQLRKGGKAVCYGVMSLYPQSIKAKV